ncbi:MAG: UDP-N-acetylmuramoyl-L-alanyl-D-glutamate--2,6-diaminopimelate ligase [Candidatus Kapabacteria bacterium]|nr:UDP-N-acetylmuramoyl-L-alanyl-D-glutamate--2,6-diaminopimelate ligase [Ignavibacteriota bacterium]MCW5885541.1 UDP-N-acetylmuramoyl-L-alanyl-D-glutamate--2,6-diaminopimelate ligase [Candidatus Kapabacteria bacterium]
MNKNISKTIGELLSRSNDYELIGLPSQLVTSIAYNSLKVKPGGCFVALKGDKFDGHNFIEDAIWNGAKLIVCSKLPEKKLINKDTAYILTPNPRKFLAEISHAFYNFPSERINVIGITGTNGKTTITYLIKSIIESDKKICGVIGTTGIFVGDQKIDTVNTTPESLELAQALDIMIDCGASYVAMEVSSHALIQGRTLGIKFKAAIFTNLTHDHLDYHKTFDEYAEAKKILFKNLDSESVAVINSDDPKSNFMVQNIRCKNIIRVGRVESDDYRILRENISMKGVEFIIYCNKHLIDVISNLTGKFNVDNAAIAAATCRELGISNQAIQHGLCVTEGAPGRMQRIDLKNGALALVDYAHTPDALEKALATCKHSIEASDYKSSRLICVFGCGGDRDKTKRPEMGRISSVIADITIITSDNPRTEEPLDIINDIKNGVIESSEIIVIEDRAEAIRKAAEISMKNDIILVAGKGHENYQIIGTEKLHFDDFEQLSQYN